jgi:V/A-type H+-transporting ATPase subunit G/H
MFEIVDEIVQAERQAEQIVSDARAEAEEIRSSFDAEERDALGEAREEAAQILRERVDAARDEAQKRLEAALSRERSAEQYMDAHADRVEDALNRVTELLLTPEYER